MFTACLSVFIVIEHACPLHCCNASFDGHRSICPIERPYVHCETGGEIHLASFKCSEAIDLNFAVSRGKEWRGLKQRDDPLTMAGYLKRATEPQTLQRTPTIKNVEVGMSGCYGDQMSYQEAQFRANFTTTITSHRM